MAEAGGDVTEQDNDVTLPPGDDTVSSQEKLVSKEKEESTDQDGGDGQGDKKEQNKMAS